MQFTRLYFLMNQLRLFGNTFRFLKLTCNFHFHFPQMPQKHLLAVYCENPMVPQNLMGSTFTIFVDHFAHQVYDCLVISVLLYDEYETCCPPSQDLSSCLSRRDIERKSECMSVYYYLCIWIILFPSWHVGHHSVKFYQNYSKDFFFLS